MFIVIMCEKLSWLIFGGGWFYVELLGGGMYEYLEMVFGSDFVVGGYWS